MQNSTKGVKMQGQKRREFVKNSAKIVGLAMLAKPLMAVANSANLTKNSSVNLASSNSAKLGVNSQKNSQNSAANTANSNKGAKMKTHNGVKFYQVSGEIGKMQDSHGYSAAVQIGNVVKISGQGGWDRNFKFPHKALKDEIAQALDNVAFVLESVGTSWGDVYSVNSYFTGKITDEVNEQMASFFKKNCPNQPLWTSVQVAGLGHPSMRVEIVVEAMKK